MGRNEGEKERINVMWERGRRRLKKIRDGGRGLREMKEGNRMVKKVEEEKMKLIGKKEEIGGEGRKMLKDKEIEGIEERGLDGLKIEKWKVEREKIDDLRIEKKRIKEGMSFWENGEIGKKS